MIHSFLDNGESADAGISQGFSRLMTRPDPTSGSVGQDVFSISRAGPGVVRGGVRYLRQVGSGDFEISGVGSDWVRSDPTRPAKTKPTREN